MCIEIQGESDSNAMVFLLVDTNSGFEPLYINKENIENVVIQLIDTSLGLLEMSDNDRDDDTHHDCSINLLQDVLKSLKNYQTNLKRG